jgi:iron only hydrogenase large subunit-like protein
MKKTNLKFPLKGKYLVMLAPSFVVDFSYPYILTRLKKLGFDKIVELTFGAKMVNREYHKKLKDSKNLIISSVCPGIVDVINKKFPKFKKNLMKVDSPMIAMGKICKKFYPKHKVVFISPCYYKKIEAENSLYVDYVIDYKELKDLFREYKVPLLKNKMSFDRFYNDYTKIYPLAGGLSKTANLNGILKKREIKIIDGIKKVMNFLKKPDKKVKFLDVNFCEGGCVGGPCIDSKLSLSKKREKVLGYFKKAKKEDIPEVKKGLIERAKGLRFSW